MNQSAYANHYIGSQQSDHAVSTTSLLARQRQAVGTWRQHHADRYALAQLSPRLMMDARISEALRFIEVYKPFWRV